MDICLLYTVCDFKIVVWGTSTDKEGFVKIKKDAIRTMVQKIKTAQKSTLSYSQIKNIINEISFIYMDANDPTGGLNILI